MYLLELDQLGKLTIGLMRLFIILNNSNFQAIISKNLFIARLKDARRVACCAVNYFYIFKIKFRL